MFEPQRAQARYCGAECRRAAKRWRDSKSRRRYRKKESGRRKRREQSRRHRRRQQERKRRGEDVLVAVEAPAWVITQEKRSSSCDRPGCYESFERTRRSPLQRFCTGACRRALYRINYHPQSGWFDEGPSKGPPPCGRGLKPPEVLLLLVFFLFLLVADVVPNNGLV